MHQLQLRNTIQRTAVPLGAIGAIGGFISDVMAPLGSFAPWVAGLSFIIFLGTVITYFGMLRRPGKEMGETVMPAIMVVAAGSALIFTGWSVLLSNSPDNGYLAENVEPIAQIQASLLNLEESVAEIQETTAQTAENVQAVATVQADTQQTVEDTAVDVEAIATAQSQGFDDIQAAFDTLIANQTLTDNPTTPQEWYGNARIYQLRGDTANAIAAYEGYFEFKLEFVDPYYEYANLLKATEGIARTRQIINEQLDARPDSQTLDLIAATLLDEADARIARMAQLAQRAPDYGPVFYELGQAYTSALRANFTQNLREQQTEAFETLFALEAQQQYSRFFLGKSRAQENLAEAQTVVESYTAVSNLQLDFIPFYSFEGLTLIVVLPEGNVQELRFSLDDPTPVNATGSTAVGGQSFANTSIGPIPLERGKHTLYVQYTDVTGVESEVFAYEYVIEDIVVNYQQQPFDFSSNGIPVIFTLAVVEGDASGLYSYNYSLDDDALDQSVQGVGQAGVIQLESVEAGEHMLYIQAVDTTGKETDVVTYSFTVE